MVPPTPPAQSIRGLGGCHEDVVVVVLRRVTPLLVTAARPRPPDTSVTSPSSHGATRAAVTRSARAPESRSHARDQQVGREVARRRVTHLAAGQRRSGGEGTADPNLKTNAAALRNGPAARGDGTRRPACKAACLPACLPDVATPRPALSCRTRALQCAARHNIGRSGRDETPATPAR